MQTPFLSHDLHKEWPELSNRIHEMKVGNAHFARLFEKFSEVDNQIVKAEENIPAMDDMALEQLKKERLRLKDELYRMLTAA